jgi:conjugal transfer mating pair stabilization protein TraN
VKARYYILITVFLIASNALAAITCSNPREECVEAGDTRYFDGAPLTLPCWKYKTTYECKADSDNNCKQLTADGCSPSTTTCKTMWGSVCAVREINYDCPTRKCDGTEIVCNDGGGFCLTGDCSSQKRSEDTDMYKALSALSAAADAAKQFDPNNMTIFKGNPATCSKDIAGVKNCCRQYDNGWLEGIVVKCEDDELQLAQAKAVGKTVMVGEYCANKVLGVCTTHHQGHCIFPSKLSRIVQVAGKAQLGKNFGEPESPMCEGFHPDDFKKIDFSKIDFSEFYQDIKTKQDVKLANVVNPIMQQKAEGLKAKLRVDAQKTKERADELRIRK